MAATSENSNRRVVPRWRGFEEALANRELDPTSLAEAKGIGGEEFLKQREVEWLDNRTLLFATDLVGAAHVLGPSDIAKQAAEFILGDNSGASNLARRLAASLLGLQESAPLVHSNSSDRPQQAPSQIRGLRQRSISEPRNAFVWADLARLYVVLGLTRPAERALRIALALAPFDRFIIRSATRFLLHAGEPDRALQLLRRNEHTRIDPWLMAAELAVSSVLEKSPKFGKLAEQVLSGLKIPPFHSSELASALASIEMWEGKDRRAKKLFGQCLIDPTENALAQTVWASKRLAIGEIDEQLFKIQNAHEALTLSAHMHQNWEESLGFSKRWARYEAFSARPYLHGSSIATSLLAKPEVGERIAKEGLVTNPNHSGLLNNIAFALIGQDKPLEAQSAISNADFENSPPITQICLLATKGLISYRLGKPEEGRQLYEKAITEASKFNRPSLKARAMLYFAREEAFAGAVDADGKLESAIAEAIKSAESDLATLAVLIKEEVMMHKIQAAARSQVKV